jgi:hypothetical protein
MHDITTSVNPDHRGDREPKRARPHILELRVDLRVVLEQAAMLQSNHARLVADACDDARSGVCTTCGLQQAAARVLASVYVNNA